MYEFITWFANNRDNITTVIAFLTFFVAIAQMLSGWLKAREKYKIDIISCAVYGDGLCDIFLRVTNLSSSPLTISMITMLDTDCEIEPITVDTSHAGKNTMWHTNRLPLTLAAYGADYYYIGFDFGDAIPEDFAHGKKITIKIQSTRKCQSFCVVLPDFVKI